MLRRWNLTILIIILAFVLGISFGYIYRDRFSWLLPNTGLKNDQMNVSQEIFRTQVSDLLKPDSGIDAKTGVNEIYSFTGRVYTLGSTTITVEEPDDSTAGLDAVDFILSDVTRYETVQAVTDANGLPGTVTSPITHSDIRIGDIVAIYTLEDIRSSDEHHVTVVQKLISNDNDAE